MTLIIQPEIFDRFPGMLLPAAVADGIDNRGPHPEVEQRLTEVCASLEKNWEYPNAQSHPYIKAWREAFRRMGLSGKRFPSSIEAMVRRVISGRGMPHINPLVDFYNAISLHHVVPAGGWDLDGVGGDIHLRITDGGEPFAELGKGKTVRVEAGEVSYTDAEEVITRHFVWRQSEKGKTGPETSRVFLIAEILPEAGREVAQQVEADFVEGLERYFGMKAKSAVLTADTLRWEWTR
jgi:DNA/RNA-binding domain of Phe-tRNA-synthetase-like protein